MWIIDTLEKAGHSAYLVGGCVRDKLLDFEAKDIDFATSALPSQVKSLFKRTIDTGLKHGTVTVLADDGQSFEVTTYRVDGDYTDSRRPDKVEFTDDIVQDLSRRDFTINAMAWNPATGLVDPFGGREDLEKKIVRTVGNPIKRFSEDALRMLRGVRFSATLGFDLDQNTKEAIKLCAAQINLISQERIRDELLKILLSPNPDYIKILREIDLLKHILPEVDKCFSVPQQNPWHLYDVGTHTLKVLANVPPTKNLRLSALFHDLGKAGTRTRDSMGIDHFYNHQKLSRDITSAVLHRLKFDNKTISTVCRIVEVHDWAIPINIKQVRRYMSRLGVEGFLSYLAIRRADCMGQNLERSNREIKKLDALTPLVENVISEKQCTKLSDLAINGRDIKNLGFEGPQIGKILKFLLNLVIDHPEKNNPKDLLSLISSHFPQQS